MTEELRIEASDEALVQGLIATVRRDLTAIFRSNNDLLNPLLFFVLVCSLFPLGIGPEASQLKNLAPGIIWIVALLACMLATDGVFRSDFDDGSLEQLLLSPQSLYFLSLAKTFSHWLLTGLPLTLVSPLLAVLLGLDGNAVPALIISLGFGSFTMSFIGAIGAALTVGLRKGGVLLSLIILPLYVPVLIFGANSVHSASEGLAVAPQLAVLAAFSLLALVLAPLAIAAGLRLSVDV